MLVESVAHEGGCPSCGVLSALLKDRPTCRVKDLPQGPVPLRVWVRKRWFLSAETACARRSFTQTSAQLPARARLTSRLRGKISAAVSTTNRAMSEVGKDYGVDWWTVHRVLVTAAADALGPAVPTSRIGIDETRARRLAELVTTLTRPAQAARRQAGATEARSHLMQERGLEVAVERLLSLMTNGEPLEHSLSATK